MNDNEPTDEKRTDVVIDALAQARYIYLGVDAEGYHHHYNDLESTIYVTDSEGERTDVNGRPRWTVRGEVDHVEDLDEHDDRGIDEWTDYVDAKRGWESYEATVVGFSQEMAEGLNPREEAI